MLHRCDDVCIAIVVIVVATVIIGLGRRGRGMTPSDPEEFFVLDYALLLKRALG